MAYETITVTSRHDGQVEWIALGPPPANIISARLIGELSEAIDAGVANAETKAIVISGTGKHFSYGASVEEHVADRIADVLPRLHALVGKILECPVPTVAAVSGFCLGGGFELAMSCSVLLCDSHAKFGVPEIKLGVFPPVASVLLPWLVGQESATKIVLAGENYDAEAMLKLGLVGGVVEVGELADEVDRSITAHLLDKSASSLRMANRAVRAALAEHYRAHIGAAEKLYLEELMSTLDANEGIRAFLEKRPPEWRNR